MAALAVPLRPPGSLSIVGHTHEPALFLFDGVQARVIVTCPTGRPRCPTVRRSSRTPAQLSAVRRTPASCRLEVDSEDRRLTWHRLPGPSPPARSRLSRRARRLLRWLEEQDEHQDPFREQTIVAYLDDYERRTQPAPATYYRRFTLLRRFFRWLSRRAGVPDPFVELEARTSRARSPTG